MSYLSGGLVYDVSDLGVYSDEGSDYPDQAVLLARAMYESSEEAFGVLLCGSGIGMSIAINRFPRMRGALCGTKEDAILSREHNDANVLVLGARKMSGAAAIEVFDAFVATAFAHGRHRQRVDKLSALPTGTMMS